MKRINLWFSIDISGLCFQFWKKSQRGFNEMANWRGREKVRDSEKGDEWADDDGIGYSSMEEFARED